MKGLTKAVAVALGGSLLALLTLAACSRTVQTVDGKAELPVPGSTAVCYLLEIDTDTSGEEVDESYRCVTREVWDRYRVDDEWVETNGRK